MKAYRIVNGVYQEIDFTHKMFEIKTSPTYKVIDFKNDRRFPDKPKESWQGQGKRKKVRVK